MSRCLATFLSLLFTSLAVSGACFAQPVNGGSLLVRHDDLDLSTASGVKALDRRIEHALDQVCFDPTGPSPAGTVDPGCKRDGRRSAQAQVALAIAQQNLATSGTTTPVSIRVEKPKAVHPSSR